MPLTHAEAVERAATITPTHYDVVLDLSVGEHEFESRATIQFDARQGASTFVDIKAVSIGSVVLNGRPVPIESLLEATPGRLALHDLQEHNELTISARMRYSHDGQGLHRAVDPVDGEAYVYGHLFMDAAPRVFACFDQPDLKAPYDLSARTPNEWSVVANGATTEVEPGVWAAATTKPLATYFVTLCAGPFATVADEHDGIPLGIHARRSLAQQLTEQAPELLTVTKQSFDYYHQLFGIRYPFGEYHQVFVPEFNAGAMENPGCVTFRDQYIFTGAASPSEHLSRANTISHEMAHMWFGDLVTMKWWDDLWLNESFAEYMANRTLVAATEFTSAWVDVAGNRKSWGYAAERSPSTHPVAGAPADDTDTALNNFDGISYAKGSAVLRQLIEHIGDEAFIEGVRLYLSQHEYGNATLDDFLHALGEASHANLRPWAASWLRTAGMDTLRVEVSDSVAKLVIETDPYHPAHRQHALVVAAYDAEGREVATDEFTSAQGIEQLPRITAALAQGQVALIVANAGDLTWGGVLFRDDDIAVLGRALAGIDDATTRAMIWTALAHGLRTATIAPQSVLDIAAAALPHERQSAVLAVASTLVVREVIERFLEWSERPAAYAQIAQVALGLIEAGRDDEAVLLAGARLLASTGGAADLKPWFDRDPQTPAALASDTPLRWLMARRLATLGALTVTDLDAALADDDTMASRLGYLTARAAFSTSEAKAWAWEELTAPPTADSPAHSNYEMNALAIGFWYAQQPNVVAPYIERYVSDIPAMSDWVGQDALARVAALAFPATLADDTTEIEARRLLESDDLPASVHRAVMDEHAGIREVLASRSTFQSVLD